MAAELIYGKNIAAAIQSELAEAVQQLKSQGVVPGLATILVGEDPASQSYVRAKTILHAFWGSIPNSATYRLIPVSRNC